MRIRKLLLGITVTAALLLTGCKKDEAPDLHPAVTSTNPINKATSIAINSKISANFNEVMDSSTITNSSFSLRNGNTIIPGTALYSDKRVTFTPLANLSPNTVYTAKITGSAKDMSGNTMATDYIWSFTTGTVIDNIMPTVILTNPANNSDGVAISHSIVVTFSEPMDQATINNLNFTLKQGSVTIPGVVSHTATTATFTPANNLDYHKIYSGKISTGIKDLNGNAIAGNFNFSFTTVSALDNILPLINSTDPLNNSNLVPRNKVVAIVFSEAMNPSTINNTTFKLKQGSVVVSGTVAYSGNTATFTPLTVLSPATTFTATITTGAKDLAGNALSSGTEWSFTTAGSSSALSAVNLGLAGSYVILAKTAINNNPTSAVTGDLGLSPAATSYITGFALTNATGFATSSQVTGKIYAADMADPTPINLTTAVSNMIAAYNDAAGRPTPDFLELGTGNIGGKTLTTGLYKWTSTVTIPTDVTLSGSSNDVWIFQVSGDLTMSSAVKIILTGGAQAKNIFWQVAGQATLGANSHFEGVILSWTGITLQTGASLNGRALAQTAVVLDGNIVTKP